MSEMVEATTFDEVYRYFTSITRVDECDLPVSEDGVYDLISNGRMEFNLKLEDDLGQDNENGVLSRKLASNELNLFGNCMKLVVYRNMLSDFVSTYSMFQKEVGFKDYKSQLEGREYLVQKQERLLWDLTFALQDDYQ